MAKIKINLPTDGQFDSEKFWNEGGLFPDSEEFSIVEPNGGDIIINSTDSSVSYRFSGKKMLTANGDLSPKGTLTGLTIHRGPGGTGEQIASVKDVSLSIGKLQKLFESGGPEAVSKYLLKGDDTFTGGEANDIFAGLKGDDTIKGKGGNDLLAGYKGEDSISGGTGDDIIFGGKGADLLNGGSGADTFIYSAKSDSGSKSADRDVIKGFDSSDKINLSAFGIVPGGSANFDIKQGGGDSLLRIDVDGNGKFDMVINVKNFALEADQLIF